MRYLLAELELAKATPPIELPEGVSGIGILIRLHDRPVAFSMAKFPSGVISPDRVRELVKENAGTEITAGILRQEMVPSSADQGFPSVTVAICTRDHPDLAKRVIHSIVSAARLAGIENRVEIIVVDNAPSDGRTRALVESLDDVRYVHEPRAGLDFARNRALEESSGELLAFVDDDAVVDRGWLRGLRRAWGENPDAAAFTGPVVPYELDTTAQILFEARGGFGRRFEAKRYAANCKYIRNYPCNAGLFGAGCNMAFRRRMLSEIGGFDNALDTGAPLPGGGDLDVLYRTLRSGFVLAQEPEFLVRHQHRPEYHQLRHQMYTWGLGMMTYAAKNYRLDVAYRARFRCMILGWFRQMAKMLAKSALRRHDWGIDLACSELWGGIVGLCGEYDRSKRRIERIQKQFA